MLGAAQWGLVKYHRAFNWEAPYGLAYNYTVASLSRSVHIRRTSGPLLERSSFKAFRAEQQHTPPAVSAQGATSRQP